MNDLSFFFRPVCLVSMGNTGSTQPQPQELTHEQQRRLHAQAIWVAILLSLNTKRQQPTPPPPPPDRRGSGWFAWGKA